MKKTKLITIIVAVITLTAVFTSQFRAETIYTNNGYSYTDLEDNKISLCGWDNRSPDLVVPDSIGKYYFAAISDFALRGNTIITSLDITQPTNLKKIGIYAFAGCENLSGEVIIPLRVTDIGMCAFENCFALESVKLYSNIKTVASQCFNNCSSLRNVELPSGLEKIDNLAFAGCVSLNHIKIPRTVKEISSSAFKGDSNLIIDCYYGSYAYEYAKQNNITFKLLDDVKLGDTDLNGVININDATMVQMDDVQLITLNDLEKKAADVNRDGEITIRDATLIQMYLANIITEF